MESRNIALLGALLFICRPAAAFVSIVGPVTAGNSATGLSLPRSTSAPCNERPVSSLAGRRSRAGSALSMGAKSVSASHAVCVSWSGSSSGWLVVRYHLCRFLCCCMSPLLCGVCLSQLKHHECPLRWLVVDVDFDFRMSAASGATSRCSVPRAEVHYILDRAQASLQQPGDASLQLFRSCLGAQRTKDPPILRLWFMYIHSTGAVCTAVPHCRSVIRTRSIKCHLCHVHVSGT